ncbi:amidase [Marinobacter sp.]|uniref:amidase n=1 Tax=Marinobacter sp. TaxID=50741 RepID=UPI00384D3DCF
MTPTRHSGIHAFTDDALGSHDATALAELIRKGELSVREVTRAAITRAQKMEPALCGIATDNFREILTLDRPPVNGVFAGVPTLVKDNSHVQGLPTCHGSLAVSPRPQRENGLFVKQYLAQGFVCLGKSTLPEFGFNASTEPVHARPTVNPWNPAYSAGASSGGSAALVAAGVVPIAHANDGGGSIRIPAACCGLVGLKPSRGRLVDSEAARSLPVNVIGEGVVTRTVRDTATFFAGSERSYSNHRLPEIGEVKGPGDARLTIGVVFDSLNGHQTDAETRSTVENTARLLESLGHRVMPMPIPVRDSFPDDFALYWGMLAFAVKSTGRKTLDPSFDRRRVDALTHGLARMFRKKFYRLPAVLWRLRRSYHDYSQGMKGYDAVLTPVLGHTTPEIGYLSPEVPFDTLFERLTSYACFTPLANATGAPAISLPMGRDQRSMPIGVQLMANHGQERVLLELAHELEAAAPWPLLGIER